MSLCQKILLALTVTILLVEVVPRVVELPGLERDTLAPPELTDENEVAFAPHPYLVMTPKPGYVRMKGARVDFTHSDQGFRGAALEQPKPAGRIRIACLGGSSTYGTGPSSDEATWPHQLGMKLRERGHDVDVLNGGVPSWNTFESLGNLAFRVLEFEPDIVLVYHTFNDVTPALWPGVVADNTHYRPNWTLERPSPLEPLLESSTAYLIWRRYLTNWVVDRQSLEYRVVRIPDEYEDDPRALYRHHYEGQELPSQGFENFRRNLTSIAALAEAHGTRPVFITQGLWTAPGPASDTPMWRDRVRGHDRATAIVGVVAAAHEVPMFDARTRLESLAKKQEEANGRQRIFVDNVHLTDAGAAALAEFLATELTPLLD